MFMLSEKKYIPLIDVEVQSYVHQKLLTRHIHLKSDSDEKCFIVAFKTLPTDSTGVAHILEHTVLCGSKKYPVRDPFFMMTRRSLSTFMNAFTASDFTAYPFSTLNNKDFSNLLSVYLDATFFPNLNELDFMQEGHRLDFEKMEKEKEQIILKGIVFNEMKGAMSSISSQADQGLSENLFKNHTYGHNSGGEPLEIPKLTYQNLLDFHKKHYHPSNAVFMTYGNLDLSMLHSEIQNNVLNSFSPVTQKIEVNEVKKFKAPQKASKSYKPLSGEENNHHVLVSWLLGSSLDPVDRMEAKLIESILLENSASPLAKELEISKLGSVPSDLTSFDTYKKQMYFTAGLEGVAINNQYKVEDMIIQVFENLSKNGVPKNLVDASLHQMEIKLKKISGGFPYGLQLLMGSLPSILHDGDVINAFDLEKSLSILKKRIEKDGYIEAKIKEMFLENQCRLTFQLVPDKDFDRKQKAKFDELLKEKTKSLNSKDFEKIKNQNEALELRQNKQDDPNILPKVTVNDIGKSKIYPKFHTLSNEGVKKYFYKAGTNGIDYFQAIYPILKPKPNDLKYSTLFSDIICEVGIKNSSYEQIQKRQSQTVGQIGSNFILISNHEQDTFKVGLKMSGYSLQSNLNKMTDLMDETLTGFRLDENERINDISKMHLSGLERSVINSGHYYAMITSDAQISQYGTINEQTNGISYIKNLKSLKISNGDINIDKLIFEFEDLKKKISKNPVTEVLVSSSSNKNSRSDLIDENILYDIDKFKLDNKQIAWISDAEVNYCAESFKTVDFHHKDASTLSVLGAVLRNGFLHTAIREKGGAYGAGAIHDTNSRTFKFFSYRDPNLEKTFDAFDNSIKWALKSITKDKLHEGILNIISSIDKPSSPAADSLSDFNSNIRGLTQEMRKKFREKVLSTTIDNLVDVTEKYLTGKPNRSIVSSKKFEKQLESMHFELNQI